MNNISETREEKPLINLCAKDHVSNYGKLKKSRCFFNDGAGRLIVKYPNAWKDIKPIKMLEINAVMGFLDSKSKEMISINALKEYIAKIKTDPDLTIDSDVRNTGKVLFKNGLYDSELQKIITLDQYQYVWASVNCNYVEDAKIEDAEVFYNFLCSSLDYKTDRLKAMLLLEIIGYAISDYTCAKTAFNLIGPPNCGKSVILEVIKGLIPEEQTSQINFSNISNRFSTGLLRDSRINLSSEISEADFPNISDFKSITACDTVMGENKCEHGFMYRPRVTLINAGNVMCIPKKIDGTDSIIDRLVFLVFENSIPQECWDSNLVDSLLEEKDIIASLAVNTLDNLKYRKFKFSEPQSSKNYKEYYRECCNPIEVFERERLEFGDGLHVKSVELFQEYKNFCIENSYPMNLSPQVFVQTVSRMPGVISIRKRLDGEKNPCTYFEGVGL